MKFYQLLSQTSVKGLSYTRAWVEFGRPISLDKEFVVTLFLDIDAYTAKRTVTVGYETQSGIKIPRCKSPEPLIRNPLSANRWQVCPRTLESDDGLITGRILVDFIRRPEVAAISQSN
jgi:hypothetical protein